MHNQPKVTARASPASLEKTTREVLDANDLRAYSFECFRSDRRAALRSHDALKQTRSMLEQAAAIIERAHASFAPLETGNARSRA